MEENTLNITKIEFTFNDGKVLYMVTQDRFLRMRDVSKAQSQANDMLVRQAELLEERIRELQDKCNSLEAELQAATYAPLTPDSSPFQNPLP